MKTLMRLCLLLISITILSGCMVHSRHHMGHGYHHNRIHLHGHVHGKPSHVIGALVAGAVIGQAIQAAQHRHYEENAQPKVIAGDSYYLSTLDGQCLWVEVDANGQQFRTQVEQHYCEQSN
jgi:hypothetical protein